MSTHHPASSRTLWKGAISFGLVHIPVALHSATHETSVDFDWLDRRTMERVGYQRINKATGKAVESDDIAKGVKIEGGDYVLISDEEIAAAYPKTTQTIAIEAFVDVREIPLEYLERPYYLEPDGKGAKVYALLRETLKKTGKAGIARVVISTREHLAALLPQGAGLVLNLLRWGDGVRPMDALELPPEGAKAAGVQPGELKMAERLVADLSTSWQPDDYHDLFSEKIMALVRRKAEAGQHQAVPALEDEGDEDGSGGADIIDLTALLRRSLRGGSGGGGEGRSDRAKDAGTRGRTAPAKKTARTTARRGGAKTAASSGSARPARAGKAGPAASRRAA